MAVFRRSVTFAALATLFFAASGCGTVESDAGKAEASLQTATPPERVADESPRPTPIFPDLQAELLSDRDKTTTSPIAGFDFRNYTYPLPRGWQNPDGTDEITLKNGRVQRVEATIDEDMPDEEKVRIRAQRRIGMSYVTTKYLDATADGEHEAIVILKVETGGAAIPQIVYVFSWKGGEPELAWSFRTGDRADGGLKDIRNEGGEMVIELYGQDRFILGQVETGKITGDEEQLCCPTYFTRSRYKWNGNTFLLHGKRLTFSLTDPHAPAEENLGDKVNSPVKGKK